MKKCITLCILIVVALLLAGTTVYASTTRVVTLTYSRARAILNGYTNAETEEARAINERTLRDAIVGLENAALQITVALSRLALDEESLRHAYIRYNFGLISTDALQAAQQRVTQQQAEAENAQAHFLTLHRGFNQLLGLPLRQNTQLSWTRTLTGTPANIERFIRSRLRNGTEAELRIAENNFRAAYTNLVQHIEQVALALQGVETAQKELEVAYTRHEMGQITRFDVATAQHNLLVSETALEALRNQQWAAEFRLLHPH
ncbi:MAG: TolC family protein [Defluviitaleaceae bacterium]|nr:TolC family protein [Defluviitaleaceae bacterium]MCL2276132.1 TolC family protein [Defluviitaleaceae bacterium]